MARTAATAKKKNTPILDIITKKVKEKNLKKSLLEVDDMVNHHLELLDVTISKETVMKQAIMDINKSTFKSSLKFAKKADGTEYFSSLNDFFKGKLFYIAYKDSHKYLKIPDIESVVDKQTLLSFVNEVEIGQEYAWALIDNLKNEKLKNFLYGIFTYIYF